jgi:hypothetical protein
MRGDLATLQRKVNQLSESLSGIEGDGQRQAAEYYASVATINTQLQSGTTPGNPRLIARLNIARNNLELLSSNIAGLNDLAMQISNAASQCSYMLESTRATYGLSGAVEEDHARLAQLEDSVNNTVVVVDRLLNNVNDDITRTTAYLASERDNLRTLSLAISSGDMFGKSLSNRPFSNAPKADFIPASASAYGIGAPLPPPAAPNNYQQGNRDDMTSEAPPPLGAAPQSSQIGMIAPPPPPAAVPSSPRPLVKIRFDRPDVSFEQPVYMAVSEALNRYPNARFELVAVHPAKGNVAEVAIESTRARRNAEKVLRSLQQMGVDLNRVNLSYAPSDTATTNEVHLYVR